MPLLKNEVNDGEDGLISAKAPLEQAYLTYMHQVAGRRWLGIIPAPTLGAKLSTAVDGLLETGSSSDSSGRIGSLDTYVP